MYARNQDNACLKHTVAAVSMASMGNTTSLDYLLSRSRKSYAQALTAVGVALGKPSAAKDDSVLTSIVLLQMYEVGIPKYLRICAVADT